MIQMVADHPAVRLRDLSSLEQMLYGGSSISEAVLDRASAALPRVAFIQVYGQSELSPVATILHARDATAHAPSPNWLEVDREALRARVIGQAKREDLVQIQLNEQLIVELYSK